MRNLLVETIECLSNHDKCEKDILSISGDDFAVEWEDFVSLADTDYDNGFGGVEVAVDLKIIGDDFIMVRRTYDGSEWWDYHPIPTEINKDVKCLTESQCEDIVRKKYNEDYYTYYDPVYGSMLKQLDSISKGEWAY